MPAGELDLRLSAEGFVPHYLWGVRLDPEKPVSTGSLLLTRGASLAGWVSAERTPVDMRTVEIQLEILAFGNSQDSSAEAPPPMKAKANARGFFQFTNVPAGTYVVTARGDRVSPASRSNLNVEELAEKVLDEPLTLRPLAKVEVVVTPSVDPAGNPWKIELRRRLPASSYLADPVRGTIQDGRWVAEGVAAGPYVLRVTDRSGVVQERQEIDVDPGMPPIMMHVALVPVKGRLRAGTRGLHAKLELSSVEGGRALIETDQEGRFEGYLPHEGSWRPKLTLVDSEQELRPKAVQVRRRDGEPYARIDFDLPGGVLRGTVSDDEGDGGKARVLVLYPGSVRASAVAGDDGEFEIVGIAEGPALVEAHKNGRETGLLPVVISDSTPTIDLVLRTPAKIQGWVATPNGQALAGAAIRVFSPQLSFVRETTTSPSGRFTMTVPPLVPSVSMSIVPPGLPAKVINVPIAGSERIDVIVPWQGGNLVVRIQDSQRPWVAHHGALVSLTHLLQPVLGGVPSNLPNDGITVYLEPGEYLLCPKPVVSDQCTPRWIAPGATAAVDWPPTREQRKEPASP